jgi:hypothetical protein
VFIVLSVGVLALNYRSLSCLVAFVLLLTMAYVGGTLLLSAYIRMIFPAVPPMLFLIGYTFDKYIRVRITTDFLPDTPSGSPSGTRRIPPAGV